MCVYHFMDRTDPTWSSIFLIYICLLVLAQVVLFASLPKEEYSGCRPPISPSTLPTEQIKNEVFYCQPEDDGFTIITGDAFVAAYLQSDAYAPAVIAQFVWTDQGTLFSRYSLWHLSDRSRGLQFFARCGKHGQTQWTANEHALRSSITQETGKLRYSMGAYNSVSVPVFRIEIVTIKLIANGILILLARHLAYACQKHVWPRVKRAMRTDPNACVHCGYDCRRLPSSICPECGHPHTIPLDSPRLESHA